MTTVLNPASTPTPKAAASREGAKRAACRHCGSPLIDQRMTETGFCCAGCSYVYRLVHEQGFAGYYNIKDRVTAPADAAVFEPRDYTWLDQAQQRAEAGGQHAPELTLDVQGISCAGCVWLIEKVFQQEPGARDVFVNAQYGTIRLRWLAGEFSPARFARNLQAFGYLLGPAGQAGAEPESRGLIKRVGLCAAFAMNAMLFSLPAYFGMQRSFEWASLFALLSALFGTLSLLVGGTYFLGRAVRAARERAMHIDLPIAIGIIGAYAGSLFGWLSGHERFVYFDFVSTFILLMLVGRWAQVAAVERNRRRLLKQQPKPQYVRLAAGGEVAPEQLEAGAAIVLGCGQTLPVAARLDSEAAQFSLASVNGESEPRLFRAGERVPSGSVNIGRADLQLTTTEAWAESLWAKLLEPGERAVARHAWLDRIVRGYVVGILVVAIAAAAGWLVVTHDILHAGAVLTAVLVVSCPCAIGLAFPLADEIAAVALRRRGVFVKEADLWAKLSGVRVIVFDKTGTLTLETPVLLNPDALHALDATSQAALLGLVRDNWHPVAECLRQELLAFQNVEPLRGTIKEVVGMGVEMDGWSLGRPGWRTAVSAERLESEAPVLADAVLAKDGAIIARFRFCDQLRADVPLEVGALRRHGLDIFILSGDQVHKVRSLAVQIGLSDDNAIGGVSPAAKAQWIEQRAGANIMMVGDGANDSLAFDRALCRGTPVIHRGVLERKADFYYLGRGIAGIRALFDVDRIRRRTQMAILVFSVAYNVLAVGLAVLGKMNPLVAAALMPANSLITLALVTGGMRPVFRR